jgi:hypothetical protein
VKNLIIFLFFTIVFSFYCDKIEAHWPWQNHSHPHSYRYNPPGVYYQPQVVWVPQGTTLNINGVHVDPYRRNVTIGVNYRYYYPTQVQGFIYNGVPAYNGGINFLYNFR